jgi:protein TonB
MKPKEILAASFLDIVFDERNKEYGAYELRVTYPGRVIKAMLFVFVLIALAYTLLQVAGRIDPAISNEPKILEVTLTNLAAEEKKPEPIVQPPKKADPPQVKSVVFTPPVITKDNLVTNPPPTNIELKTAAVDDVARDGNDYDGRAQAPAEDNDNGAVTNAPKVVAVPEIVENTDIPATYDGNWARFLTNNLRGDVPIDNGAPAGRYTVMIQFVVGLDGSISDVKPLTRIGFGMEEEAMRVLKKAKGWRPGIYKGSQVKSYHRQPITFEVIEQ